MRFSKIKTTALFLAAASGLAGCGGDDKKIDPTTDAALCHSELEALKAQVKADAESNLTRDKALAIAKSRETGLQAFLACNVKNTERTKMPPEGFCPPGAADPSAPQKPCDEALVRRNLAQKYNDGIAACASNIYEVSTLGSADLTPRHTTDSFTPPAAPSASAKP